MPKVYELYDFLSNKFPASYSSAWDNDGMMFCVDKNREVVRVLCALDVTDAVVEHAINGGFDVIVSHHPMIFTPYKSILGDDPRGKRVMKLMENKITVMSFHTRLDAAPGGLNDVFANLLGLRDVKVIETDGEHICRMGTLEIPLTCAQFASEVKKSLKAERVLYAESGDIVYKVALCGGDGKSFVKAVKAAGADTYLTGQLSYNIMEEASDMGLNLLDAGHFATEDFIASYLTLVIMKEYTQVQTAYFNSNLVKAV